MCKACKYPREFKPGDIVQYPGDKAEILKRYLEPRNNELDRVWYQIRVLGSKDDSDKIIDIPCNTLCYVSPEGNKKIYAKPGICEGCNQKVRLYYPETMGPNGYWVCPECGLAYPFMFYRIQSDELYIPEQDIEKEVIL